MTKDELRILLKESGVKTRVIRDLRFVPEEITEWDDRDLLAVTDKSRQRGVLIFEEKAVSFLLHPRRPNRLGRIEPVICDICRTWQRGSNSGFITFNAAEAVVTFLCCLDLECSFHVRNKTPQAALSRVQLRENMTIAERVARLNTRLRELFASLYA